MSALWIIIPSLLFAAFFSGMETAFMSASRLKIELNRKQGKFPSAIIAIYTRHPAQYLSTVMVGYHIAMVIYGVAFVWWLVPVVSEHVPYVAVALVIAIAVASLAFFLFADYLPKVLFRIGPNVIMNVCALPLVVFYGIMYPVTGIITGIARIFIRVFARIDPGKSSGETVFARADPDDLVLGEAQPASKEEQDAEHEIKIFQNAIDFSTVKIRDCMIPRTDIVAVEENTPIAELKQKFIDTGVSKIIVYNEDIDHVIGYVHSKELFKNPQSMQSMINLLTFVPETMSGNRMMQLFMQERRSIAIVVDEYGGTAGLLTLEDLIEEIFGDIEDEHDKDNLVERQIKENEFLFSGRLEIEYINETFRLNIPEKDDYDTLAGFILYHHLNLPLAGEMIRIEPYTFIIRKVTNTRIDLVQMTVNK
ncbi:MAG: hemolysin family protein [Bacteroidales bacterium]|jgi:CBS domain containing-hemolysin-like protein|nr:hemolysin family protein [Bacteroidales bacterium]